MGILIAVVPFLVLFNFMMICVLVKKTHYFAQVIAKHERREHTKLERETWEALRLLKTGKTEEAKEIAERIVHS